METRGTKSGDYSRGVLIDVPRCYVIGVDFGAMVVLWCGIGEEDVFFSLFLQKLN